MTGGNPIGSRTQGMEFGMVAGRGPEVVFSISVERSSLRYSSLREEMFIISQFLWVINTGMA